MRRWLPPSASAIGYQTVWFDVSPWIATMAGPRPGHSCVASVMESTGTCCTRRPLVGARADLLVEVLQPLGGEPRRLAVRDDLPLVRLDLGDRFGEAVGDLGRERERAMVVGVDQVARLDPETADLDGQAEVVHVHVGVRHRDVGGGELEAERAHLVEIPDRAVREDAGTAERLVDVRLDLAPLGALAARLVEVVHDDDARRRDGADVVPPRERGRPVPLEGRGLGADERGDRVADKRPQLGEERADLGGHEPLAPRADVERFDPVREARARDLLEGVDRIHQIESFRRRISRAFSLSAASCTEDRFGFTASARSKYSSARVGWSSWR